MVWLAIPPWIEWCTARQVTSPLSCAALVRILTVSGRLDRRFLELHKNEAHVEEWVRALRSQSSAALTDICTSSSTFSCPQSSAHLASEAMQPLIPAGGRVSNGRCCGLARLGWLRVCVSASCVGPPNRLYQAAELNIAPSMSPCRCQNLLLSLATSEAEDGEPN